MRRKPMLAYPVSAKPIDYSNGDINIQPKLDGVRCVIQYNLDTARVTAYSRTGKEWKNIEHILEQLKPFFQKYPNVILDGELYNHDLRDNFETMKDWVGETATFTYFERTKANSYRHPLFKALRNYEQK